MPCSVQPMASGDAKSVSLVMPPCVPAQTMNLGAMGASHAVPMAPMAGQSAHQTIGGSGHAGMDHAAMGHAMPMSTAQGQMAGQPMLTRASANMDHSEMVMQGGSAPADARDPNAYSGGYTLESGPSLLPGPRLLRLADEHSFSALVVNRLERGLGSSNATPTNTAYDIQAWLGQDYNRVVWKAEGEASQGRLEDARTELLWSRAIASFWDGQLGIRHDGGEGPGRNWLTFGLQGLAPNWVEVDAAAYVGDSGRTALRVGTEYDLLLNQSWVLQPRAEVSAYGKDDAGRGIGSGLSNAVVGVRLRYEINRQVAPYMGVERTVLVGKTADFARADGATVGETRWVAGLRFWF